eukprot:CAMPEP_0206233390 /NCGR_PEP_ID=MMETSP0047_2-20121206/11961_1 /ASSEMBLY_ACC=CAM_ASM_000192 /TAXON_ID=195065 /ORGANISM="Chroomonas mesostigmatica_cf, Strain CCMP1168" /LENGTH=400 /DNA_ID=CAMNT_0053657265 /DNA_START=133 /DNA_END=1335 /DNA_ORIENTATION=+
MSAAKDVGITIGDKAGAGGPVARPVGGGRGGPAVSESDRAERGLAKGPEMPAGPERGSLASMLASAGSAVIPSVIFSCSSIGMILLNKGVMRAYPFSGILLVMQTVATIVLLVLFNAKTRAFRPQMKVVTQWLPIALLFCFNLFSSLQSMKFIGVATFSVLRYLQPCFSVPLDWLVRGIGVKWSCIFFLFVVFLGSLVYAYHDLEFDMAGYVWALLHNLSMTCYLILVKLRNQTLELSANDMSLYNNALSLPFFIILATLQPTGKSDYVSPLLEDTHTQLVVLASCAGGFCVSVTAFHAQKALTPTSFITLNNLSKIPAILISCIIFSNSMSHLSAVGMVLSLAGGYAYALASGNNLTVKSGVTIFSVSIPVCIILLFLHWMQQKDHLDNMQLVRNITAH